MKNLIKSFMGVAVVALVTAVLIHAFIGIPQKWMPKTAEDVVEDHKSDIHTFIKESILKDIYSPIYTISPKRSPHYDWSDIWCKKPDGFNICRIHVTTKYDRLLLQDHDWDRGDKGIYYRKSGDIDPATRNDYFYVFVDPRAGSWVVINFKVVGDEPDTLTKQDGQYLFQKSLDALKSTFWDESWYIEARHSIVQAAIEAQLIIAKNNP